MDAAREATMREAEYYRSQSEFWADMAEEIKRPDYQDRWLKLAQHWRELAEQADQGGGPLSSCAEETIYR